MTDITNYEWKLMVVYSFVTVREGCTGTGRAFMNYITADGKGIPMKPHALFKHEILWIEKAINEDNDKIEIENVFLTDWKWVKEMI